MAPYEGLYCFQELVDYDLARVVYSPVQFLEYHVRSFIYQVLCGVKYIHSADVIHRDLKPGNILVSARGVLKICDFGLARAVTLSAHKLSVDPITNYVATRWYRAPELILRWDRYGKPVDMWAVGCILAELYGRQPLMPGKSSVHQLHEIVKYLGSAPDEFRRHRNWPIHTADRAAVDWCSIYPFAGRDAHDLIGRILTWLPADRLTVELALGHRYFSLIRDHTCEPWANATFRFGREEQEREMSALHCYLREEVAAFQTERRSGRK